MAGADAFSVLTTYQHDALESGQIRVLVLLPGDVNEDLWAYFETGNLEDRSNYKALSYAWGAPKFTHNLHLVGGNIAVTHTVDSALRRLRNPEVPTRLWVDAICINQRDIAEKNLQVTMMAQIFNQSQEVIIWLGGEDDFDFDCNIYHMIQLLDKWYVKWFDWRVSELPQVTLTGVQKEWPLWQAENKDKLCPHCPSFFWSDATNMVKCLQRLNTLWTAPWFGRLWVVQEAAAGVHLTFLYGRHVGQFISMKRAAELSIYITHELDSESIGEPSDLHGMQCAYLTLAHISRLRNPLLSPEANDMHAFKRALTYLRPSGLQVSHLEIQHYGGRPLYNSIWLTGLSVSVPHDLLYAIRAISQVENVPELRPDYDLSLSELWKRVAVHMRTQRPRSSVLLSLVGTTQKIRPGDADESAPSWVPDFKGLNKESRKRYNSFYEATSVSDFYTSKENVADSQDTNFSFDPADSNFLLFPGIILFNIDLEPSQSAKSEKKREFNNVTYIATANAVKASTSRLGV